VAVHRPMSALRTVEGS